MTGDVPLTPLSDVPLLGDLIGLLDKAAEQLGFAFWIRGLLGLVYAGAVGYLVLWLFVVYFVPWAGTALLRPARIVIEGLRAVLLVPDWAISRICRRARRVPPQAVYDYGDAVMRLVDRFQEFTRQRLPKVAASRFMPRWLLLAMVGIWFLTWGTQACVNGAGSGCVSPLTHWTTSSPAHPLRLVWLNGTPEPQ